MHWIPNINPVQPDIASPGRLVTNRKLPQNYYNARGDPDLEPTLAKVDFRELTEIHRLFNNNKFHANLASFFSKRLSIESDRIRSIEATKGEKCQLVQADEWLSTICSAKSTQAWLERNINSLGRKVWMITDTLVLTDTMIKSIDQHQHSIGGEISAPVLSMAGVTIPTPLDPSVGANTIRDARHEGAVSVPDRMVFAIQYMRVKLHQRKRGDVPRGTEYGLHSKATWTPLWEMRGEAENRDSDSDRDSDEYDAGSGTEDEEVVEAILADDSDDEDFSDEEESSEGARVVTKQA